MSDKNHYIRVGETQSYVIVATPDKDEFVNTIDRLISQGWQPIGMLFTYNGLYQRELIRVKEE